MDEAVLHLFKIWGAVHLELYLLNEEGNSQDIDFLFSLPQWLSNPFRRKLSCGYDLGWGSGDLHALVLIVAAAILWDLE